MDTFYSILLTLHNLMRWVAMTMAVLAVVTAWIGWLGKRTWSERQRKIGSFTAISLDVQLLLGLLLYIFGEYGIKGLSKGMEFLNANRDYRFFGMEHIFYMLVALVLAHLGSILPRKAQDSPAKFMRAAIPFSFMLILILIAIPWWRPLLRIFGFEL